MNRRDFVTGGVGAVTALGIRPAKAGADETPQAPLGIRDGTPPEGDIAILNARLVTLEPQRRPAEEAVLVHNSRIALIGSNSEVRKASKDASVFDAAGRVVVPGFIDDHCHFEMTCNYAAYQVDCHTPPHASLAEVLATLRQRAAVTPAGQWIIGRGSFGWPAILSDRRMPTRQDLDAVTDRHPLVVMSGLHVAMFNTLGFKATGLWDPDSQPARAPGALVHRDARGLPTGVATEVWPLLPDYSEDQVREALRRHAKAFFTSKGMTSLCNLPFSAADLRADQMEQASGHLPIRLRSYYHVPKVTSLDAVIDSGMLSGVGNDMFRFGGVKMFIDGIGSDGLGNPLVDLKFTQQALNEFVFRAHSAGIQLMMHVIRHEALELGMNAVEAAQRRLPKALRHRFEHAEPLRSVEDMQRLRRLGCRVTITPLQEASARADDVEDVPWRTMVREGLEPIAISDSTGTIPQFSPLDGIASVMAAAGHGGTLSKDETLSFEDALRSWTIWAAKGAFEEAEKGSIAMGKMGDFAVLAADPRRRSAEKLFGIDVDATILGGSVVHLR